jgi:hypothetical protein
MQKAAHALAAREVEVDAALEQAEALTVREMELVQDELRRLQGIGAIAARREGDRMRRDGERQERSERYPPYNHGAN